MPTLLQDPFNRFMTRVNKNGPVYYGLTPCWIWTGYKDKNGYGVFWFNRKQRRAHKWIYEWVNKTTVTANLRCCHKCDNTSCVNPSHLFISTDAGNHKDRDTKNRQAKGIQIHLSKLTDADILKIRADNRILGEIAKDFNVTKGCIGHIKTKRNWKHI